MTFRRLGSGKGQAHLSKLQNALQKMSVLINAQTGCAVKRWWSTAGVKPARELVRSTR
jgi:hypothetical protein